MCYKSRWGRGREKRRPSTLAGGHGDGLLVSSRAATILARRPTSGAISLQLKIAAPYHAFMGFYIGPDLILGLRCWCGRLALVGTGRARLFREAAMVAKRGATSKRVLLPRPLCPQAHIWCLSHSV